MSGLRQFTPPSMKGLNYNIDANLNLGATHGIQTDWIQASTLTYLTLKGAASNIVLDVNSGGMSLWGSFTTHGANLKLYGEDYVSLPSGLLFSVKDAGKAFDITVFQVAGVTDTPYLDMQSHRIAALANPTTAGDALPYMAWTTSSSLIHTWTGATPANWAYTFRYMKIGKTCFYSYIGNSADSNATTGLVISVMPYTAANAGLNYHGQWMEGTGAGGNTFNDAIGYLPVNTASVQFLKWVTPTDGQALYLQGTGFYEVA